MNTWTSYNQGKLLVLSSGNPKQTITLSPTLEQAAEIVRIQKTLPDVLVSDGAIFIDGVNQGFVVQGTGYRDAYFRAGDKAGHVRIYERQNAVYEIQKVLRNT